MCGNGQHVWAFIKKKSKHECPSLYYFFYFWRSRLHVVNPLFEKQLQQMTYCLLRQAIHRLLWQARRCLLFWRLKIELSSPRPEKIHSHLLFNQKHYRTLNKSIYGLRLALHQSNMKNQPGQKKIPRLDLLFFIRKKEKNLKETFSVKFQGIGTHELTHTHVYMCVKKPPNSSSDSILVYLFLIFLE